MTEISSFPPVYGPGCRVLILGSMPGEASLRAGAYYAHPHNAFWRIMGAVAGAGPDLPYDARLEALRRRGIALWDVLQRCERPGSLDSAIRAEVPNDFAGFFACCPFVEAVFFNGGKAEQSFRRLVLPGLEMPLRLARLPSTSPAYASMRFEEKLAAWRAVSAVLTER